MMQRLVMDVRLGAFVAVWPPASRGREIPTTFGYSGLSPKRSSSEGIPNRMRSLAAILESGMRSFSSEVAVAGVLTDQVLIDTGTWRIPARIGSVFFTCGRGGRCVWCAGAKLGHLKLRPRVTLAWLFGVGLRRRILTDRLRDQCTPLFTGVFIVYCRTVIGNKADVIVAICFRFEVLDLSGYRTAIIFSGKATTFVRPETIRNLNGSGGGGLADIAEKQFP